MVSNESTGIAFPVEEVREEKSSYRKAQEPKRDWLEICLLSLRHCSIFTQHCAQVARKGLFFYKCICKKITIKLF